MPPNFLWFSPYIYKRQGERATLPCPSVGYGGWAWAFIMVAGYGGQAWVFCFFHNGDGA